MATLYNQKDSNIRRTWFLMTLFFVVVIGIGWVFSRVYGNPGILAVFVVFSVFMNILSYWYSDKIVLKISRAKEIKHEDNRELYHIVENLAISSGLPTPRLYLIDEAAPNAFATGRNPEHAVVAVTRGLLERLDRSELEGVLAHEFSHIGNRDMLLSTVVVVLIGFVALLSDFFLRSNMFGISKSRDDNGKAGGVLILVGIIMAILAPIALNLMQLAISRKREFLADASGAFLTRYPEGLAKALEKIASDPTPLRVANKATNHLWVSSPVKNGFDKLTTRNLSAFFSTHPPIEERVKRLREMNV
ncbi:MAG: M48 family metallopeptidase [Candidatus Pacebacteria bacterium]|nr:M48 family metallopeptidase [Candidatus Paceibacterota bacterium]